MFVMALLVVSALASALAIARFVRTPDPDRPRAYPKEPERWHGITERGHPARLYDAVKTSLFYLPGIATSGAVAAVLLAWMPASLGASLAGGLIAGAATSVVVARRLLQAGPGAMSIPVRASKNETGNRPRVLFICGSPNQTSQMHQIALALPEVDAWFTPYFSDHWGVHLIVKLGLLENTIMGFRRRGLCLDYLNAHALQVDLCAERNRYDLCLSCNDQAIPREPLSTTPWILVQEGIQEPPNWRTRLWRILPVIPRGLTSTATFGLSDRYARFCVASEGYRRRYLAEGIAPEKLVVTGIPNFDNFERFRQNRFPYRGYVLVCTSDGRETLLATDRHALLRRAVQVAAGRQLIFKLHPNERVDRATHEIRAAIPDALIFAEGSAEEMVANCDVLLTEWSSLTFCGVALGKEVHSLHSLEQVKELLPIQHARAAEEIGGVVRDLLKTEAARTARADWLHRSPA
jgi:hypothetical protein